MPYRKVNLNKHASFGKNVIQKIVQCLSGVDSKYIYMGMEAACDCKA
jgi:hypothetical protein